MRESGRMLALVQRAVAKEVSPGVSTKVLAEVAARELKALGGEAPFLGHEGYPDVICLSVNDEIVHGIPSTSKVLSDGDIIGIDFGVRYRGMITDGAITVPVGKPKDPKIAKLLSVTKEALEAGIAVVRDQVRVGDISAAIEHSIRAAGNYGIPRELVGHGVGHHLWEEPNIPNYGRAGSGPWLLKDMTIAIEPMVTLGTSAITVDDDGWTIRSADGSWAAHFEHTVLITEAGAEIITRAD
jgi:methionyl aminopeptidase